MKGSRRERLSCSGTWPARVHTVFFAGMWYAADSLWCMADHGGCQKSVKSLINVSAEHHWRVIGLQLSHLSLAALPSAFQVWESSCAINHSVAWESQEFSHGEEVAALQVVVSVREGQVPVNSSIQRLSKGLGRVPRKLEGQILLHWAGNFIYVITFHAHSNSVRRAFCNLCFIYS